MISNHASTPPPPRRRQGAPFLSHEGVDQSTRTHRLLGSQPVLMTLQSSPPSSAAAASFVPKELGPVHQHLCAGPPRLGLNQLRRHLCPPEQRPEGYRKNQQDGCPRVHPKGCAQGNSDNSTHHNAHCLRSESARKLPTKKKTFAQVSKVTSWLSLSSQNEDAC